MSTAAKKAEAAIRYFEERGHKVASVTIKRDAYTLDYKDAEKPIVEDVDLVDIR